MTTLQEALPCPFCGSSEGLDYRDGSTHRWGIASCVSCGASSGETRREYPDVGEWHYAAMKQWNTRSALAQQGEQQPVAWYEYNQDLDAWFLAYWHNPKAKTRPLVFGDTAAPAPQPAQDGAIDELEAFNAWFMSRKLESFPKDYDKSRLEGWAEHYRADSYRGWLARAALQSAQPVAPLTDEQFNDLVMQHLGPHALTGGKMSVYDAFLLAVRATEAAHGIREAK